MKLSNRDERLNLTKWQRNPSIKYIVQFSAFYTIKTLIPCFYVFQGDKISSHIYARFGGPRAFNQRVMNKEKKTK